MPSVEQLLESKSYHDESTVRHLLNFILFYTLMTTRLLYRLY